MQRQFEQELDRLKQRRAAGRIYVSLFGEISAGKSSLIRALLPNAEAEVSVRGGTTREVRTDAAGEARVPVLPGRHYMLDAVVLRAPAAELAEARDVVWESIWANLTFAVPDR